MFIESEDGIVAVVKRIVEEVVVDAFFAARDFVGLEAVRQDHVIDALKGVSRHLGILRDQIEILLERAFPVLLAKLVDVLLLGDQINNLLTFHRIHPHLWELRRPQRRSARRSATPPHEIEKSPFGACRNDMAWKHAAVEPTYRFRLPRSRRSSVWRCGTCTDA